MLKRVRDYIETTQEVNLDYDSVPNSIIAKAMLACSVGVYSEKLKSYSRVYKTIDDSCSRIYIDDDDLISIDWQGIHYEVEFEFAE